MRTFGLMPRRTIHHTRAETIHGDIRLAVTEKGVCWLSFDTDTAVMRQRLGDGFYVEDGEMATGMTFSVRKAFQQPTGNHSIPLALDGTEFQRKVWQVLQDIPSGETRSYGALARQLGRPNASRAVGAANGQNPVAVLVPCHRVIAGDGSLGGYAGGLALKEKLLTFEGARFHRVLEQPSLF